MLWSNLNVTYYFRKRGTLGGDSSDNRGKQNYAKHCSWVVECLARRGTLPLQSDRLDTCTNTHNISSLFWTAKPERLVLNITLLCPSIKIYCLLANMANRYKDKQINYKVKVDLYPFSCSQPDKSASHLVIFLRVENRHSRQPAARFMQPRTIIFWRKRPCPLWWTIWISRSFRVLFCFRALRLLALFKHFVPWEEVRRDAGDGAVGDLRHGHRRRQRQGRSVV